MTTRMSVFLNIFGTALMIFGLIAYAKLAQAQTDFISLVQHQIEQQIRTAKKNQTFVCHSELICGIELVPGFYTGRGYKPAWIEAEGPRPLAGRLVALIHKADAEGLNPGVYHLASIKAIMSALRDETRDDMQSKVAMCADLDILLTDAYLFFGSHLLSGRVNPETIHTDWVVRAHRTDLMDSIERALVSQQIEKEFELLKPPHFAYTGLRDQLRVYRKIRDAGGWPQIPPGPSLRLGVQSKRVMALRSRLEITGDFIREPDQNSRDRVDADLMAAVQKFQRRHGLKPDGIAGKQTIAVMNISASERVRQIEINWQNLGRHYFPFKLRQDPGPKNALGRIKFMFPNKFAVYIHDTPHRALFNETIRNFSSGCIRAEEPIELAHQLLIHHPRWRPEQMQAAMQSRERQVIRLKQAVPVHLLYLTAWIDAQGRMQFRRDIYNRDPALDNALHEKAPRPTLLSKGLLINQKRVK